MYQQNYIPMPYIILIIYKNKSVNFFKKIIKIILIFFFFLIGFYGKLLIRMCRSQ